MRTTKLLCFKHKLILIAFLTQWTFFFKNSQWDKNVFEFAFEFLWTYHLTRYQIHANKNKIEKTISLNKKCYTIT